MQEKYKKKGLVLVALSYEPKALVAPYVTKHNMSYIVGADAKSTKEAFGIDGYPTAFLIDPDGKVAWKGHPLKADKAIEDLLKSNPPKTGGALSEEAAKTALLKADKLYKKGQYTKALTAYEKVARDFDGTKSAKKAGTQIKAMKADPEISATIKQEEADRTAKRWLDMARVMAKNGADKDAVKYYKRIIQKYPKTKYAETARTELADLTGGA